MRIPLPIRGRGASENPPNRFETLHLDRGACHIPQSRSPRTRIFHDATREVLSTNRSPDVPFDHGINPYRGCEHGCSYCYARQYHEYLGFSSGLDFETKIVVKRDAPALLRRRLSSGRWTARTLMMSGATDPYQPIERRLRITRGIVEVLAEFRNPVAIITKNHLVTRELDLLVELARHEAVFVVLSVTTLQNKLQRVMEPRTSTPYRRLAAICALAEAGVPVGANLAPVIPGLTDHEIPAILRSVADAGATFANYVMLRLPQSVARVFEVWLEQHFPERKDKILNRLRDLHGNRLYDSTWRHRVRGSGVFARQVDQVFRVALRRTGLEPQCPSLSTRAFRRPKTPGQLDLF